MQNRAERRRAVKEVAKVAVGMTPEALRQKALEFRRQAETMQANFHRLIGAAIAYEEMAKAGEMVQGLAAVPKEVGGGEGNGQGKEETPQG